MYDYIIIIKIPKTNELKKLLLSYSKTKQFFSNLHRVHFEAFKYDCHKFNNVKRTSEKTVTIKKFARHFDRILFLFFKRK